MCLYDKSFILKIVGDNKNSFSLDITGFIHMFTYMYISDLYDKRVKDNLKYFPLLIL